MTFHLNLALTHLLLLLFFLLSSDSVAFLLACSSVIISNICCLSSDAFEAVSLKGMILVTSESFSIFFYIVAVMIFTFTSGHGIFQKMKFWFCGHPKLLCQFRILKNVLLRHVKVCCGLLMYWTEIRYSEHMLMLCDCSEIKTCKSSQRILLLLFCIQDS